MAQFLVIRLGEQADQPVSWIAVDDQGTRRGNPGSGSLEDAAREVHERQVIALVPATEVLTLAVDVPAKGGAKLRAALPFALEDQLADDIEDLHFAAGAKLDDGRWPVAVVARERMADWTQRLEEAGINVSRIIPENHGLARTPNTLSMLVARDLIMFNDGGDTVFAIPDMRPSEAIAAAGLIDSDDEAPARHLLVYCDASVNDEYEKDWALLRHELSSVDVNLLPDGVLPKLAVTVASGEGINLLQGQFGPRTEMRSLFRPWRFAAIFLLAFGIIGLLGKGADLYRLSVERDVLKEHFATEYCKMRPGTNCSEIADPVGLVRSLQGSLGTGGTATTVFLPSLLELAGAIRLSPDVEVQAVNYRAGVFTVRVNAPDIPSLDRIVQHVMSTGKFTARVQDATNVGERVDSRIEIRETGA